MCVRDFHNKTPLVTLVRDFTKYTQIGVSLHHDIARAVKIKGILHHIGL